MRALVYIALVTIVSGCGSILSGSLIDRELDGKPLVVEAYLVRGFLSGSNYERYHLSGDVMWRECGEISSGTIPSRAPRKGDTVFPPDSVHQVHERHVEAVTAEELRTIRALVEQLIRDVNQGPGSGELRLGVPPGPGFSLSDPGTVELSASFGFDEAEVITSVDALVNETTNTPFGAKELIRALRGVGPVMCGQPTFFGISRR